MDANVPAEDLGVMACGFFATSLTVSRMDERLGRIVSPLMVVSQ